MGIPSKLLLPAFGLVAFGAYKLIETMYEKDEKDEPVQEPSIKTKKSKKTQIKELEKTLKQLNDELARLIDIQILNEKRESTGQVSKAEIKIDGVELYELISLLEKRMKKVLASYYELKGIS